MNDNKYHPLIVTIHWIMAIAIIAMLLSGLSMSRFAQDLSIQGQAQYQIYQLHKSSGIILMLALILRITTRVLTKAPPLPQHFPKLEALAAHLGHFGLYIVMTVMVLSGWAMVSTSPLEVPTILFGKIEWPHIPFLNPDKALESIFKQTHLITALALIGLIAAHIAATIKHAIFDKENLLKRMIWPAKTTPRNAAYLAAFTAAIILLFQVPQTPKTAVGFTSANTAPQQSQTTQTNYAIDYEQSQITFQTLHSGDPVTGTIESWSAQILFHPEDLPASKITATLDMSTATTGNLLFDGSLEETDWLDIETHPKATFKSTSITHQKDTLYAVTGNLTVKGVTQELTFTMHLTDLTKNPVKAKATHPLNRLTYTIGKDADPKAEWVDKTITVNLEIIATKQN